MEILIKEIQFLQKVIKDREILNKEDIQMLKNHLKLLESGLKMVKEFYEE